MRAKKAKSTTKTQPSALKPKAGKRTKVTKKTKVTRQKSAPKPINIARFPVATARLVDQALPSAVALMPQRKQRHALYNGLVLAGAIFTLAALAGSAVLPMLPGSTKQAFASRPAEINVEREIDRAVAEGRPLFDDLPLIVATIPRSGEAPKSDIKRDPIAPIKTEIKSEPPKVEPKREAVTPAELKSEDRQPAKSEVKANDKKETKTEAKPPAKASRHKDRQAALSEPRTSFETLASVAGGSALIAEARKYLGRNPTGRASAWCGAFLDMVLRRTGHRGGGNLARGYINYGKRLPGPEVGAIVVFSRVGGGHVGIVTGIDANGNPIVISGNHNKKVAVATYPAKRVLAYVSPGG